MGKKARAAMLTTRVDFAQYAESVNDRNETRKAQMIGASGMDNEGAQQRPLFPFRFLPGAGFPFGSHDRGRLAACDESLSRQFSPRRSLGSFLQLSDGMIVF